jgi:hypothetical protein
MQTAMPQGHSVKGEHLDEGGHEQCLNINECVSTEAAALDPKCTCERCACKDTKGGYE